MSILKKVRGSKKDAGDGGKAAVKAKKPKKKQGILEKIGINVEREPTQEEAALQSRAQSILRIWEYLRLKIDMGTAEYLQTGDASTLQKFVGRPAIDSLIEHLDTLRAEGVTWEQPNRKTSSSARTSVISDSPDRFIIEEAFTDRSVNRRGADERVCPDEDRVIRVTVAIRGGQEYQVLNVMKVAQRI